jgi:hypothetical protein
MFLRFKYERSLARYFWLQRIFDEARWKQTFIRSAASGKLGSNRSFFAEKKNASFTAFEHDLSGQWMLLGRQLPCPPYVEDDPWSKQHVRDLDLTSW